MNHGGRRISMAIVTFRSESVLKGGLSVENRAGKFTVLMDEPETLRGTDTGMNPVEMLLCCLGACQCIVARLFARARKIEFQDLRVELEGDLDTDGFLRGKDGVRAGLHEIRYTFHIRTDADEEKVSEFVDFVKSRCPVNDSLLGHVPVIQKEIVISR
jgi:uncharacterized OsmC-like protein